jgi:TPR repeat protein
MRSLKRKRSSDRSRRGPEDFGFKEACDLWDAGELHKAFIRFKSLAEAGDRGAQSNLGYFLANGLGVRKNWKAAFKWYRRAYAGGQPSGAINIGIHYKRLGKRVSAVKWFLRAAALGDDGALLSVAEYLITSSRTRSRARGLLRKVVRSREVAEVEKTRAADMLRMERGEMSISEAQLRLGDGTTVEGVVIKEDG